MYVEECRHTSEEYLVCSADRLVELAIGHQPGVGGHPFAQELQLQMTVETDLQVPFWQSPPGFSMSMARNGRTPLFLRVLAQITCLSRATRLGNVGPKYLTAMVIVP